MPASDASGTRGIAVGLGMGAILRPSQRFDSCCRGMGNATCLMSGRRSEEHTSELQSLMRISYAVFCLKKKKTNNVTENKFLTLDKQDQQMCEERNTCSHTDHHEQTSK